MNISKNKKSGSSEVSKFNQIFPSLSKWTAYAIGLVAAFTITVKHDPQGVNLIPLAEVFVQAAQVRVVEQKKKGKLDNPDNSTKKQ